MNSIFAILGAAAVPTQTVQYQAIPVQQEVVQILPILPYNFFIALITGVILAVAFELILTNLSLAAGLNVLGSYTDPYRGKHHGKEKHKESSGEGVIGTVRKITGAMGAWTLITASIALFFATWLAVELSLTGSLLVGAVIGLVVWGLFYVAMITFETSAIASLVGSVGWVAASGLKSAYQATAAVFTKSPAQQIADAAVKATKEVRQELFGDLDAGDLRKSIQSYIDQLKPQYSPKEWRNEIAKLLDDVEFTAAIESGEEPESQRLIAKLEAKGISTEQARTMAGGVKEVFSKIKEERASGKPKAEQASDAAMRVMGLSSDEAKGYREKFENYLRNTRKEQLDPDAIKADIERLFSDPRGGMDALKQRLSAIDKDTIVSIISQRKDIDPARARQIVDKVQSVIFGFIGRAKEGTQQGAEGISGAAGSMKERFEGMLRNYFDSLGRPEFEFSSIKADFMKLFTDPKAGADAMMSRLRSMDRESIKAIVSSRKDVSPQDAERIVEQFESSREEFLRKAQSMKDKVAAKVEHVKDEALHQVDETRRTAATAAWWSFATALLSGVAAAAGGVVAVMTRNFY